MLKWQFTLITWLNLTSYYSFISISISYWTTCLRGSEPSNSLNSLLIFPHRVFSFHILALHSGNRKPNLLILRVPFKYGLESNHASIMFSFSLYKPTIWSCWFQPNSCEQNTHDDHLLWHPCYKIQTPHKCHMKVLQLYVQKQLLEKSMRQGRRPWRGCM